MLRHRGRKVAGTGLGVLVGWLGLALVVACAGPTDARRVAGQSPVEASTAPPAASNLALQPGSGTDVGVGANGSVWLVGANPVAGGFGIWHWTGSAWAADPGGAVRVAVDPGGNPWLVNSLHAIYHWSGAGSTRLPGSGTDVGVGANGSVWLVGANPVGGGFGIWHWTGSAWAAVPGGAVTIAVDPGGNPWVINSLHSIYHWNGAGWTRLPGSGTDVGVGANGSVWLVGTNPVAGGFGIWHWTGTAWAATPGRRRDHRRGPRGQSLAGQLKSSDLVRPTSLIRHPGMRAGRPGVLRQLHQREPAVSDALGAAVSGVGRVEDHQLPEPVAGQCRHLGWYFLRR